jgi:hypothetical protein
MAVTTYAELQTAVVSWTNRTNLTARIPEFIALAEVRIWAKLRAKSLTKDLAVTYIAGDTEKALPTDLISVVSLRDTAGGRSGLVEVVSYDRYQEAQTNSSILVDTTRTYVVVTGRQLLFVNAPTVSGSIVGRYLAKEPALSGSVATNEILTQYPDLYLFASLIEAYDYLHDDSNLAKYVARFGEAMDAANQQHAYIGERAYRSPRMTVV